jgi:hypothetical protein
MPLLVRIGGQQPAALEVGIGDIFVAAYGAILSGSTEQDMSYHLGVAAAQCAGMHSSNQHYAMEDNDVVSLRHQFEALGLVQSLPSRTGDGHPTLAWSATGKGRKYVAKRTAKTKEVRSE